MKTFPPCPGPTWTLRTWLADFLTVTASRITDLETAHGRKRSLKRERKPSRICGTETLNVFEENVCIYNKKIVYS